MARYDSPGFNSPLPGVPVFDSSAAKSSPGTSPVGHEAGGVVDSVALPTDYMGDGALSLIDSSARPHVDVHAGDTQITSQYPSREPVSGVVLDTGGAGSFQPDGQGSHIAGPAHPNANRVPL